MCGNVVFWWIRILIWIEVEGTIRLDLIGAGGIVVVVVVVVVVTVSVLFLLLLL